MSDKNADLDVIGGSHLPADLFTQTLGSNYGLDGFPDMQYGMGVLDGVLNPDAQDAPAFPTGVQKGAAAEMDLTAMLEGASLADLDWLDPSQPQDPERLPHTPESIPELVEAWGVNRRTDGVHTAHQVDLDYVRAMEGTPPKKKASARTIEKVLTHAMRRSIEGQHIDRVIREAAESMGEEMERVVPLLHRVKADHGLAGNVFIRASAYPGWGAGKWKAHAKKHAAQARYLLVSEKSLKQASWIQDGRCTYTGKIAVAEVPWQDAYRYYMPRLVATGRKVAAGAMPAALREAFLSQPVKKETEQSHLPTHKTPDQRVSAQHARSQFAAYQPERVVLDPAQREAQAQWERVSLHLARMERDHLLPHGEHERILASGQDPVSMLRAAARIATQVKRGSYQGDTRAMGAQSERRARSRLRAQEKAAGIADRLSDYDRRKCAAAITQWIDTGVVSNNRVRSLLTKHRDVRKVAQALFEDVAGVRIAQVESESRVELANGYNSPVQVGSVVKQAALTRTSISADLEKSVRKAQTQHVALEKEATERAHSLTRAAKQDTQMRALVARVQQEVERGARGSYLRKFISKTIPQEFAESAVKLLAPTLLKTGALEDSPAEAKKYDQPVFSRAASEAVPRSVRAGQIKSATKWLRKSMSEGFAGMDLDALITHRFAKSLLDAAGSEITQLRQAHEGLSGFLYVDAEVYASEAGAKGCEAGGTRHRANQIPNVRAMSRCGTCTMVRVREDGTRKCGTYNKTLVDPSDVSGAELDPIKRANIASCDMTDAEATASLFAPSYDPNEFGLDNRSLEDVSFDNLPENAQIAEILFDGWKF
jgi:hypothetical protein